ncbi:hypothetical protein JSE7799_01501 [Jannaschia seosinensis]|uniref:Uncharacterized protein n=1 Tax=Jannaschia seosinensis TaxID=313367 RepID=A0A0M7BAD5_9RHOB|nr:hypothetical protein [Jannaschia seosinensis]CUH38779.1 hypothetical protein JSE7799_01501 [Jannaschia seosinensis]
MSMRHEIRLVLLAVAIIAGLALQEAGGEIADCDTCTAPVEAV